MKKATKITVDDYRNLHKNGNRVCFDYFSTSMNDYFHLRLLDGCHYKYKEDEKTVSKIITSYILIHFYDDCEPDYYQFDVKAAFDLLAMHSRLVNFPHYNPGLEEKIFIDTVLSYIEGAR
jgi:hypothetical protein